MFTIDQEKLEQVISIFNQETDPAATDQDIKAEICADWHNMEEHQEWLDTATAQEIADWLSSFYN